MPYRNLLLSLVFICFFSPFAFAQRAEIGVNAGGAGYMGDLNPTNPLQISGINAGVFARINFDPYWGLGLHYNYGKIKANDLNSTNDQFLVRALNFNTGLNEVSLIANLNFFDIYSPIAKKRFTPYIFAGIGGIYFKPKANYQGREYVLSNYKTNLDKDGNPVTYKPYAIAIPYGAGVKYRLSDNLTLFSQIGYRTALTDYIDDVGDYYTGFGEPDNPNPTPGIGLIGTQRGDLRKRDTYMFVSIGISYTFVSQKCFTF